MFTGIIEEVGKIISVRNDQNSSQLMIQGKTILSDLKIGDSVAVNGVCLTVAHFDKTIFTADVMNETQNRSTLGVLKKGDHVNLERAMPANGRFGGHIVSGHIDGTGTISQIRRDDNAVWFTIKTTPKILSYIVEKGSIAIEGISLTVAGLGGDYFEVSVIPHTMSETTLLSKKSGDRLNLENDLIGKYVERFLKNTDPSQEPQSVITAEFLAKAGF